LTDDPQKQADLHQRHKKAIEPSGFVQSHPEIAGRLIYVDAEKQSQKSNDSGWER
jgi:hypothetical protein